MRSSTPLVRVLRGGHVESVHHGSFVVVERDAVVLSHGDVDRWTFYRSTSKPLQALAAVTSGAADAWKLTPTEIALATGSHSGASVHVEVARSILAKAGVDEKHLGCGGHWSSDLATACEQRAASREPLRVWSNCSGKHATMLAIARHRGAPLETYLDRGHPVQREIHTHMAAFTGIDAAELRVVVDGCGAPTFAVPLVAMARSLGRLADPSSMSADLAAAARRVVAAMRAHPDMVAGEGRFDTDLMRLSREPLVAKAGAEGVHGVGVPSRGMGIAVKAEDGGDRGYRIVVVELLRRLGVLASAEADELLRRHASPVVRNWAGDEVGRMEVCF
jgi:L-asparaginase II